MQHLYVDVFVGPLAPRVNVLIQRIVEQGLISYFDTRTRRSLNFAADDVGDDGNATDPTPKIGKIMAPVTVDFENSVQQLMSAVTLNELHFVLIVSSCGLASGLIVFMLELMCRGQKG